MTRHLVSLTVGTNGHAAWSFAFSELCNKAKIFDADGEGLEITSVNVSSQVYDPNEPVVLDDEYYDEFTMLKVHKALEKIVDDEFALDTETQRQILTDMIDALQKAGILFRERRKDEEES